jgi:putative transcriptional regulator
MASKAFRAIEAGMRDAIAYLGGDKTKGVATAVEAANLDVAKVREKTGLSQDRFASAFAINASTLRNWEQGRTRPDGAARVLLTVIDRDPEAVLEALRIGVEPAPARAKRTRSATSG